MPTAVYNGDVIAKTDEYQKSDDNVYFPPGSVNKKRLKKSKYSSTCFWKGRAIYYDVISDGRVIQNAAWQYKKTEPNATHLKKHFAFNKQLIEVQENE